MNPPEGVLVGKLDFDYRGDAYLGPTNISEWAFQHFPPGRILEITLKECT